MCARHTTCVISFSLVLSDSFKAFFFIIINLSFVLPTGADDSCVLLHINLQSAPGLDRRKEERQEKNTGGMK